MAEPNHTRERMAGKIAVITGGMSGIGDAIGRRFESEGATVVRLDISAPSNDLVKTRSPVIRCDVSDESDVGRTLSAIIDEYGQIDILVNSAGVSSIVPFLDTSLELYDKVMAVNLRGAFLISQGTARHMVASGRGVILNIASVSGILGSTGRAAYGTSKAALIQLSNVMARELGHHGIRVNVLAPGPVETPMSLDDHSATTTREWTSRVPMHRYGSVDEMAGVAAFLCSDDAAYVTGSVLSVDGGFVSAGLMAC